jgi:hypothetical protein
VGVVSDARALPVASNRNNTLFDDLDPVDLVDATRYSLTVSAQEAIRVRRYLGFADLISASGERVSASSASIESAMADFRAQPFTLQLLNGLLSLSLSLASCPLTSMLATSRRVWTCRWWGRELADGDLQSAHPAHAIDDELRQGAHADRLYVLGCVLS